MIYFIFGFLFGCQCMWLVCKSKTFLLKEIKRNCPELIESTLDCEKSFTGKCLQRDEGYDEVCIFCGQPDERQ